MSVPESFFTNSGELLAVRYDVRPVLETVIGADWQADCLRAVEQYGRLIVRDAQHPTCREADPDAQFALVTVDGGIFGREVPGMWTLYQGLFRNLMQDSLLPGTPGLRTYDTPDFGLECVTQLPVGPDETFSRTMEAHVDMRRTGVLVVKGPMSDEEGRLVIANNPDAQNRDEILEDCIMISHKVGSLVCFAQGDIYPHFTEANMTPGSQRTVVSLNYPKPDETAEAAAEILRHAQEGIV